MKRRGKYLWFRDIEWGTRDKIERIMFRVGNRYAQHSVYHKKGMGDLENQLIRLRSAAHDDVADALAMLPEMLNSTTPIKKVKKTEDEFNWWRAQTIAAKKGERKIHFVFGSKGIKKAAKVPCTLSYR